MDVRECGGEVRECGGEGVEIIKSRVHRATGHDGIVLSVTKNNVSG